MPSLGVGYEIGRAVAMNKPILCLYRPQPEKSKKSTHGMSLITRCYLYFPELSAMIRGIPTDKGTVVEYKEEDIDGFFEEFFKTIKK